MLDQTWTWLARGSLQWRFLQLTMIGLLVIFVFFWLIGRRAVTESTEQSLKNQLTVASLVASLLEHRLNAPLTMLEITAGRLGWQPIEPAHRQTSLLRDAQLQLSAYGRQLFWLDTDGHILWTEPFDATLLAKPFPDFPVVQPAIKDGRRYVSNLCRPGDSSLPYILLAVPIFRSTGEVDSLLVEEIGANQLGLEEVLAQVMPASATRIEVIDHQGVVLASNSTGQAFKKEDHADQFRTLIDSQQPTIGQCHQCHTDHSQEEISRTEEVLAFAPLTIVPWGVAVRQPADEVMAPIDHLRWQIFLIGGGILIATLLITWLLTRQIVQPIQALDKASAQFAKGKLDVPIPHGGIDEIARLTASLEEMRVRLDSTLKDHRRWNEALEEMVTDRTHELATLYGQLQGKEMMCKRLLGKVLTAQEEERARLARELHDIIGQSLTAIIITTNAVESSLPDHFVSGKEKLAHVRNVAAQALQDLRGLIFDLRPEVLDDLGLALALHSQVKKYLEPAGIQVQLRAAGLVGQLPVEVELAVFRVVQEAITNIARHAQATKASITLTKKDSRLIVRVEDNGVGFDLDQDMQGQQQGWGLRGMEERITLLGGKFYVGSRPGGGTLVLAEVPFDQVEEL